MTNEFTTLDTTRIAEQVGFTSAPNKMTWTMLHKFAMIVHQEASSKVDHLEAQRQQLREALGGALRELSKLSIHMQCKDDGIGPDCTDYFQAQLDGLAALKATGG